MFAVPRLDFRLPKFKARYPHLLDIRNTTRERGNDFQGWTIYIDGSIRIVDGETSVGWGAVLSLTPSMEEKMSCLVRLSPPRVHLAVAGARIHCNNTVEMYHRGTVFSRAPWPGCP